jgi:hypothetical protein
MVHCGMGGSVVYALGLPSLMVFGLGVLSRMVFALGVLGLCVFTLGMFSLMMFGLGVFTLGVFGLMMFGLGVFTVGLSTVVEFALWVFTYFSLSHIARAAVIGRVSLVRVTSSLLLMRTLGCCCRYMLLVRCRLFLSCRFSFDTTGAVETEVIVSDRRIVDYRAVNVGIVDDRGIHTPNCRIIVKGAPFPSSAIETRSIITETIVDTAVEPNMPTPITAVPAIIASAKSPVARRPKKSRFGHFNPDARNPKITILSVGPVAGSPKISIPRTRWLLVDGEWRRRNGNRDRLSEKRRCQAQETCQQNIAGSSRVQHSFRF